ncbi:TPA: hypothetical protein I8Z13_000466 [Legionella pneumophila]|nr:hypothetical protein [Legionella pneumophila]HAT1814017.1 hypothetical protein [Legionella pneumophila]HBD7078789.1 hypothetical protein [Legionella pneumophila]HBD7114580.1 hypothetical protein [Legionella pneumophila]HBD7468265.1 hypothetical protein [Legionella pneumophila]
MITNMTKKDLSTFEREMQHPLFRKQFEKEYTEFLLSEIIKAIHLFAQIK